MTLEQQLIDLEKSLAGFHPTHYIRQSIIDKIAILKPKAQAERSELADPRTLEQRKQALEKTLSGFHPTHYIRDKLISQIADLDERIKKNKRLN